MKTYIIFLLILVGVSACSDKKSDDGSKASANKVIEEKVSTWRSPGGIDFQVRSTSAFITEKGLVHFFRVGSAISAIGDWPNGTVNFIAKLRGEKALGEYPCAEFYVDAEKVGRICTSKPDTIFKGSFKKNKDQRILSVRFMNDAFDAQTKEDRNLMLVDFKRQ